MDSAWSLEISERQIASSATVLFQGSGSLVLPDHVLDFINRHAVSHVDPKSPESPQDKLLAPLHCSPHVAITLPTDSWPSGRRRTPGKCVGGEPSRGFESLTVRHIALKLLGNFPKFLLCPPKIPPSNLRLDAMLCDMVGDTGVDVRLSVCVAARQLCVAVLGGSNFGRNAETGTIRSRRCHITKNPKRLPSSCRNLVKVRG